MVNERYLVLNRHEISIMKKFLKKHWALIRDFRYEPGHIFSQNLQYKIHFQLLDLKKLVKLFTIL